MNGTDFRPRFLPIPQGPQRRTIEETSLRRLRSAILDQPRRRPRYFDGRFLAARDLTREQEYFLDRQASLGRALGAGVIQGLEVEMPASDRLRISAGHGLTPAGELVALSDPREVDLSDIPGANQLNAAFGLRRRPQPPIRNRSGLFVVALRPVEFTANPIASYPTSIDGRRSAEDGEVVEATAITLVPYPDPTAVDAQARRRARVARQIFVDGVAPGLPAGVLPLAMVELERGQLVWLDPFLVRRELGSEPRDLLGLDLAPAGLRRAAVQQYELHLRQVLLERARRLGRSDAAESGDDPLRLGGQRFAAAEHFLALPPTGPMPVAAVDPATFVQSYFPAEIEAELALAPDDEIPALVEASLHLPPIDLTLEGSELESVQVLVLVPLPRGEYRRLRSLIDAAQIAGQGAAADFTPTAAATTAATTILPSRTLAIEPPLPFRPRPLDLLRGLGRPRLTPPRRDSAVDAAWRQALQGVSTLWFVRRTNLRPQATLVGAPVELLENRPRTSDELQDRLGRFGRVGAFRDLRERTPAATVPPLESFLGSEGLESRLFFTGALAELEIGEGSRAVLTGARVMEVQERFSRPDVREGHERLLAEHPELASSMRLAVPIAEALRAPELARIATLAPGRLSVVEQTIANLGPNVPETQVHQRVQRAIDRILQELGQ